MATICSSPRASARRSAGPAQRGPARAAHRRRPVPDAGPVPDVALHRPDPGGGAGAPRTLPRPDYLLVAATASPIRYLVLKSFPETWTPSGSWDRSRLTLPPQVGAACGRPSNRGGALGLAATPAGRRAGRRGRPEASLRGRAVREAARGVLGVDFGVEPAQGGARRRATATVYTTQDPAAAEGVLKTLVTPGLGRAGASAPVHVAAPASPLLLAEYGCTSSSARETRDRPLRPCSRRRARRRPSLRAGRRYWREPLLQGTRRGPSSRSSASSPLACSTRSCASGTCSWTKERRCT